MRPRQWVKNVLVLLAPLAAGELLDLDILLRSVAMLVLFCLVASGLYLHNDLRDRSVDLLDPRTAGRPIAAGTLAPASARRGAWVLITLALVGAWLLGTGAVVVVAAYVALTFFYSVGLKRVPYLELLIVASGFLLRTVAGATASMLPISAWFLVVVSAAAVLVVTAKRTAELIEGHSRRQVLGRYTLGRLSLVRKATVVCTLAGYASWVVGQDARPWGYLSLLVLGAVLVRFEQQAAQGRVAEPETYILRDPLIAVISTTWFGVFVMTLLGGR
jgi:decaprenyl-phosphate phosphoribosyltransferase